MSDDLSPEQRARADLLAVATAVAATSTDPDVLHSDVLAAVMADLDERTRSLDVATVAVSLVVALAEEVAVATGDLAEDVLQRVAIRCAAEPIPRLSYDE